VRITIQDYRHIAKAIDREHVRRERAAGDEDEDGEAEAEADDVYDLAAGHTTETADAVYGIDAAMLRSLTSHTLAAFRAVSSK
jgi:ATP phosphoribosyltransferase regulatory subunit HisZ